VWPAIREHAISFASPVPVIPRLPPAYKRLHAAFLLSLRGWLRVWTGSRFQSRKHRQFVDVF
jgi:hypothetical protein